jgi:hypothetical protein
MDSDVKKKTGTYEKTLLHPNEKAQSHNLSIDYWPLPANFAPLQPAPARWLPTFCTRVYFAKSTLHSNRLVGTLAYLSASPYILYKVLLCQEHSPLESVGWDLGISVSKPGGTCCEIPGPREMQRKSSMKSRMQVVPRSQ